MKKNVLFLTGSVLVAGLTLATVAIFGSRHGINSSATPYELTLSATNGRITDTSYSETAQQGTAKTSLGNDFGFTYKSVRRFNATFGSGFALFQSAKGELVSSEGVSGLLSISATVNDHGEKLYVSFAASLTAGWTTPVVIEDQPIESPAGMGYFKLTAPDGAVYCETVTIRYTCNGIEPPVDSSEDTSEQTSSTESSQTSSPSGSSSSATPAPTEEGTITFNTSGNVDSAITSLAGMYSCSDVSVSSISVEKAFVGSNNSVRLATGSAKGSLTVNLSEPAVITGVKINAAKYGSDNPSVDITTSANPTGGAVSVLSKNDYACNAFASDTEESSSVTVTAPKGNRIYLYSITLTTVAPEPIYPTSISIGNDIEIAEGGTKKLSVSYNPGNTNVKQVSFASSDTGVATVSDNGTVTGVSIGTATITATATAASSTVSDTLKVTVTEAPPLSKTEMKYDYTDYTENNIYSVDSAPTKGSVKLLVIPIWFTNSSTFISESKKETIREDIQKAYLGTTTETGWHSVKSYYETESMNSLSFEGTVSSWYSCNQEYATYGPSNSGGNATVNLVTTATNWYFNNNPSEQRTDYDRDGDGYLDGIMLIYAAPDFNALGNSSYSNLWAYCYWVQDTSKNSKTNPGPNTFFWASYDFMYDSSTASAKTGTSNYASGDCSHCSVDAHTFIHEMGHVFGLDDYYDYGSSGYKHAGGFSMQDYNIGGHDPFSVMAYGWADPYIPTNSCEITISAFQKNHDLILLTPEWNGNDSPWDEYLLLELYTPTGLNQLDSSYSYASRPKGPTQVGIRLWHVDARLAYFTSQSDSGSYSRLTTNPKDTKATYGVYQAFTDTCNDEDYGSVLGAAYDKYNLLKLIRNNTSAPVHSTSFISNSDLFGNGSNFSMSTYKSQFSNSTKLNKNIDLGWSFSVAISGSGNDATATLTLTKA